ncbi:MAG TPA: threonine/serine dehydratase [Gemmatimonadales bacterium]|jgi:threonine dehydratase|nr:threonine/serine dehydratase [Gemmatimonadales bacterium]
MTLDDLREAQHGLRGVAERTPLVPLDSTTRLKAEYLQPIHAFKIRGAWTALRRLSPDARARGVVTSSSGNHGLGVAYAARRLGVRAVVVMPESATGVKIDGIRALGAEVLLVGKTRGPEQTAAAERLAQDDGLALIPPFDYPDVIAGQGTVGMEILEDWPEVDTIVVPVGGGGLIAGISCAVRALKPGVTVIAAEPALVPKLSAAIQHGKPTAIPVGTSLADGLLSKSIGQVTWPLIRETVREAITVTEDQIVAAVRWLAARDMRVEPSGAVTTAAWLSHRDRMHGNIALVCTGGNVDPARYAELVA